MPRREEPRGLSHIKACCKQLPQHGTIMRTLFGISAFIGMQALAAAGGGAPFAADAQAVRETIRLVRQDCGACHGMTLQGGLGTPLTREALAGQSPAALAIIILHGKHGTAMPPWKSLLSEGQAQWIAERLLEGFPEEARP